MRRLVAIAVMVPLVGGCLLELSPRPGTGVVGRGAGTTVVVFVDASTGLEEAGAGADAEADTGGDAGGGD